MIKLLSKLLYALFIDHVHCFCDKKYDVTLSNGNRIIIVACNKCGLEECRVIKK